MRYISKCYDQYSGNTWQTVYQLYSHGAGKMRVKETNHFLSRCRRALNRFSKRIHSVERVSDYPQSVYIAVITSVIPAKNRLIPALYRNFIKSF